MLYSIMLYNDCTMASSIDSELDINLLIVGGGLAGQVAALEAAQHAQVLLISNFPLTTSSSAWAQGGIAAALSPLDSPKKHFEDTLIAGRGLCDPRAVEVLVNEGPSAIQKLVQWGVSFESSGGEFDLGREGGHSERRIAHALGGATGKAVMGAVTRKLLAHPNIRVSESHQLVKLLVQNEVCHGSLIRDLSSGNVTQVHANAVILALGGSSGLYERTTNPASSNGEGLALAYDAGAELRDLEFVQFHPTALCDDSHERTLLISEAVRGEGAYLLNGKMERFMPDVHELAELAPRDVVARAVEDQNTRTSKVFLSLRHLNARSIRDKFYSLYQALCERGIDLTSDLVPVAPAAHYSMGGIRADLNGLTSIPGLYACGEVASVGIHGANRLASNSMLECVVFGLRAGNDAALAIGEQKEQFSSNCLDAIASRFADQFELRKIDSIRTELRKIMTEKVGVRRSQNSLESAIADMTDLGSQLAELNSDLIERETLELQLKSAALIARAALQRNETRGSHARTDFPERDDSCIFSSGIQKAALVAN